MSTNSVSGVRRLAGAAAIFAFFHLVFGAIVRISGSGFGCGDHWPKCQGYWFPPLERIDLIIEVTHRYLAAGLSTLIVALLALSFVHRSRPSVGGRGGVLRAAALATGLVFITAVFGAVIVKLKLENRYVVVVHLALGMSILATLIAAHIRAGGLWSREVAEGGVSARTSRGAIGAAAVTFAVLVLGALTANLPGASISCTGFPLCRNGYSEPLVAIQLTHRILAFLLTFHVIGLLVGVTRRRESPLAKRLARLLVGAVVLQILVASALVEMHLPLSLRSLHQAVGTLVWVAAFVFAMLARRAAAGHRPPAAVDGTGIGNHSPFPVPDSPRDRARVPSPA